MSTPCDQLERFHQDDLSPEEVRAFQIHAASCARCQEGLFDVIQLDVLTHQAAAQRSRVLPFRRAMPSVRRWIPLALAASVVGVLSARLMERARRPVMIATADHRSLEARLSHPGANRFRPYSVPRAAEGAAEEISQRLLADLEERRDYQGLATAYLLQGAPKPAAGYLDKAGETPDVDSDRAILALDRKDYAEALRLLERALKAAPKHPQALWNRGLVLRDLGLPLASAEAFEAVAALGEAGWAEEARQRAEEQRKTVAGRQARWRELKQGGEAMVEGGAPVAAPKDGQLRGLLRLFFYDAVRSAPSRERVEALLPLAGQLDELYGGDVLRAYVRRVAAADFSRRGPLAQEYGQLAAGKLKLDPAAVDALLRRIQAAGQDDIEMGALVVTGRVSANLERYVSLAERSADPWFSVLSKHEQAKARIRRGELLEAEVLLGNARAPCLQAHVEYRCVQLELELAVLDNRLYRFPEARAHALEGLRLAQAGNEWELELMLLEQMGDISYFEQTFALGRAYLREALLRWPNDCNTQRYVHNALAEAALLELDPAAAAVEARQVPTCDRRLSLRPVHVLANLMRRGLEPSGRDRLAQELARIRETASPGERALADYFEGYAIIEQDRERGRELLQRAIAAADLLPPWDVNARKARAYGYAVLALDAGRAGEFDAALELIGKDLQVVPPSTCALGVALSAEREVLVVRDAQGRATGALETRSSLGIEPETLVPAALSARLDGCARVEVLAQPPVQGQPRLLPPPLAWSYRLANGQQAGPRLPERRVVVSGVEPPASLGLKPLRSWEVEVAPPDLHLQGASATPSAVLATIADATEIEFHVHGQVDVGQADATSLILSPDASGKFELKVSDILQHPLRGAPLVVLGACGAGVTLPWAHQGRSLPAAFLAAGARAVIASPSAVKDDEALAFFEGVRQGIRSGLAPAAALRAERARWLSRDPRSWARDVMLFE